MIFKRDDSRKVFAEGVAKDILRIFSQPNIENAEFQVMQMNKNNGVRW